MSLKTRAWRLILPLRAKGSALLRHPWRNRQIAGDGCVDVRCNCPFVKKAHGAAELRQTGYAVYVVMESPTPQLRQHLAHVPGSWLLTL